MRAPKESASSSGLSAAKELRLGIVGAGRIVRERHLPGFRALPGVRIVGVCNQRRETAARFAREFSIPRVFGTWEDLVEDPNIDAVLIGAWPYVHCPVTLAALDAGKHVLTQARMAMNAREAQRMLERSRESPRLTAMIAPSPYGLTGDAYMRQLIGEGYLGPLREVHVTELANDLADPQTPLSWRQMTKYSGFNMVRLGILYETAMRWTPPVIKVLARAARLIPSRPNPQTGQPESIGNPDSVQVLTTQRDGSLGVYRHSQVIHHEKVLKIALYGGAGTLVYDLLRDEIRGARAGEPALHPMPIPDALRGGWRAEADFVASIREGRPVTRTDFVTGVRYMQFTEAVARSSRHEHPVELPLKEFSNPSL